MNKSDLISLLATRENLTEVQAARIMKLIFDGFKDALVKGDRIEIRGFGSIVMREYRTYTGRNPKTGDKVEIKPKRLPYFKVGKELKEKVNGTTYTSGLEEVRPVR
jgi:integration host factor subunit beta